MLCGSTTHESEQTGEAVEDKRRLAERVVSLQDVERKEIARELHDEFGPHLFALRAHISSLMRIAENGEPDVASLRKHGSAIWEQVNALQQFNRRVLEKLRPVGLAELGLREALGALLRLWREAHPEVVIETVISPSLGEPGETADLTIYRIIQEALTNVFRHADAPRIVLQALGVNKFPGQAAAARTEELYAQYRRLVSGLCSGLLRNHRLGHGLFGMRERVLALGGTVTVTSADGGVTVEALVPCDERACSDTPVDERHPTQQGSA